MCIRQKHYPHLRIILTQDRFSLEKHPAPVLFLKWGRVDYICRFHARMSGAINVVKASSFQENSHEHTHQSDIGHHDHSHAKHFHGFVTGGRSAKQFFLTHTPVLADERHHFQVILQGSLKTAAHAVAYDSLRKSDYGNGKVQIFHDHLSLTDIRDGKVKLLPQSSFEYYPNDPDGILGGTEVPGLEKDIPVSIDKVLHFHTFEKEAEYPSALTYLIYGNQDDVFIDHYIDRAPSFHSVAKLKTCPEPFKDISSEIAMKFLVPSKVIRDVSPKIITRVAFVDNSFHLFWVPPPGIYARSLAQDPLIKREGGKPEYEVLSEKGIPATIEIERFLHFDVRLLNYGVLIV